MLPFFVKALNLGLGVIVLNPNVNSVRIVNSNNAIIKRSIPHNETPDMHVLYFFRVFSHQIYMGPHCCTRFGF